MDRPFFQTLAKYLAESLEMDFVCIDRLEGDGLDARTVAVYSDGHFEDNVTYALKDTPCGDVVGKTVCCFPASVCQFFPRDQVLQDLRAESYVGVTLFGLSGQPIGLIAVISRRPLANRSQAEAILQTVGLRAAAELERLDAEEQKAAAFEALQHEKDELKRWQSLTVGRELVMIGMKKEVNALLKQAGQPDKYEIVAGKTE
jgi:GAF domain-containing protein